MKMKSTFGLALLGLFLLAILAVPVAAVTAGQETGVVSDTRIDPGLKEDLWELHKEYRLSVFDLHVQEGGEIIGLMEEYGYDTSQLQQIMSDIAGMRGELQAALSGDDRAALHHINDQLRVLWHQFRDTMRMLLRSGL